MGAAALTYAQSGDCFPSVAVAAAYAVMTSGVAFRGTIASIPAPNQFIVTGFIGFGAGAFADVTAPYQVFVFRDNGGASAAPQGETQVVTAYNTATGQIDHTPFSTPLVAGDQVILMHPRIAELAAIKADTAAILDDTGTSGVVLKAAGLATDAAQEIATATWVNTTRTLTTPIATPAAIDTTTLPDLITGVTYVHTLTGMIIPATWARCYVTFKDAPILDTDALSTAQLIVTQVPNPAVDGLSVLNRAPGVLAQGSLVVDQVAGTVAITITALATAAMTPTEQIYFDVKFITNAGAADRQVYGTVGVVSGVTRATS
jgi:hypothetical protein